MNDQYNMQTNSSAIKVSRLLLSVENLIRGYHNFEHARAGIFGLTIVEAKCLKSFDRERYLTVKGLAQGMNLTKSRIVKLIDNLQEKGLVERVPDPRDGRVCMLGLTNKGHRVLSSLKACCAEAESDLLRRLSGSEVRNYREGMANLSALFEELAEGTISVSNGIQI